MCVLREEAVTVVSNGEKLCWEQGKKCIVDSNQKCAAKDTGHPKTEC